MTRTIRIGIIGGALWSVAGIALIISKIAPVAVSVPVFDAGVVILSISLVYAFFQRYRKDSLICDERAMHIVMYGLAYSWFASLAAGVAFLWCHWLHWLKFTAPAILLIWVLFMSISGFFFYLYLAKRGTVE
jgi:hypothetical protein